MRYFGPKGEGAPIAGAFSSLAIWKLITSTHSAEAAATKSTTYNCFALPVNLRKGIQDDEEFRARYRWLLPADRSIPSPAIPQESFSSETRRTRAARPVRSIYRQRFTAARRRRSIRYGLLVAAVLAFGLAVLVLTS